MQHHYALCKYTASGLRQFGKNCREMGNAVVHGHGTLEQLKSKAVLKTTQFIGARGYTVTPDTHVNTDTRLFQPPCVIQSSTPPRFSSPASFSCPSAVTGASVSPLGCAGARGAGQPLALLPGPGGRRAQRRAPAAMGGKERGKVLAGAQQRRGPAGGQQPFPSPGSQVPLPPLWVLVWFGFFPSPPLPATSPRSVFSSAGRVFPAGEGSQHHRPRCGRIWPWVRSDQDQPGKRSPPTQPAAPTTPFAGGAASPGPRAPETSADSR